MYMSVADHQKCSKWFLPPKNGIIFFTKKYFLFSNLKSHDIARYRTMFFSFFTNKNLLQSEGSNPRFNHEQKSLEQNRRNRGGSTNKKMLCQLPVRVNIVTYIVRYIVRHDFFGIFLGISRPVHVTVQILTTLLT